MPDNEQSYPHYPWRFYAKPFRIYGNLYHVGSTIVCTHLIDTGEGLILIDPGYPQCLYGIVSNIYELGFNPKDIKKIIVTHGHYDHLGAVNAIKNLCDAKVYLGAEDRDFANGKLPLTWAEELGFPYCEAFEPDVLINDGDVITLGNTNILCRDAAGHTPGTKAFFFDVYENGKPLRAAMHGGVGFNSMKIDFLKKYGLSTETRERFVPCIKTFIDEPVDIHLGNHKENNNTFEKARAKTADNNPFIDNTAWKKFLTGLIENYNKMIAAENA